MEGNALKSPVNPFVPNITQLLLLLLFWRRNTNRNYYGAFCIWVTALPTLSLCNSIKQHLRNFVSGDKHTLISFTTAVERWVKKTCIIACSLNHALTTFLHFWQQHSVDTCCTLQAHSPQTQNVWGFFFFSWVSPMGFSSLSKCTCCSIDLFSYFFQNFTRTHWRILLNALKLSYSSPLIIKAAFSAEAWWTNKN